MNFDKFFVWATAIVLGFAAVGKIDVLQHWIWKEQAKLIMESRTSNWGSPRFFPDRPFVNSNSDKSLNTNR